MTHEAQPASLHPAAGNSVQQPGGIRIFRGRVPLCAQEFQAREPALPPGERLARQVARGHPAPRRDGREGRVPMVRAARRARSASGSRASPASADSAAGVPHYWIVRMARNDGPAISVERFRLSTSGEYVFEGIAVRGRDLRAVDTMDPLLAQVSWEQLGDGI